MALLQAPGSLREPANGRTRRIRLSLTALAILGTGSALGVAFSLYLVNHLPLLLIALSPLGRHVVLITPLAHPVAIVAVVVGRRLLFYAASFQLGRDLGPAGIEWLEERAARFARWVRWIERLFNRASRTVVLVGTGPTIAALAGISGADGNKDPCLFENFLHPAGYGSFALLQHPCYKPSPCKNC